MSPKAHTFLDVLASHVSREVDSVRLILVLDPRGLIEAPNPLLDNIDRAWEVCVYDRNDLVLRKTLIDLKRRDERVIVIARGSKDATIDLSYIPDIVEEATDIIDCSPSGLLSEKIKDHLPPDLFEEPLISLWSDKIDEFISSLSKFRKMAGASVVMNRFDAMAVTLATSCSKIGIEDLTTLPNNHIERIVHYVKTVVLCDLTDQEMPVLKTIIFGSEPHPQLLNWCNLERSSLIRFLYFGIIAARYAVPRGIHDLEKLGLLDFDLHSFDESTTTVIRTLKDDVHLQMSICAEAEKEPDLTVALSKLLETIKFVSFDEMLTMLMADPFPAVVVVLGRTVLKSILESQEGKAALIRMLDKDDQTDVYQKSPFSQKAHQTRELIKYFGWFARTLSKPLQPHSGLPHLIEMYHKNGLHLLDLNLVEIKEIIRLLKDDILTNTLKQFISQIEHQAGSIIDMYDQALAKEITTDFSSYVHFQQLNTQTLRNLIQAGIHRKERVWIIVLDGLRLDSWDCVVWPRLKEFFEVDGEEQLYLSTLPSYTDISRVAFFAGKPPSFWKDYFNNPTTDHNILLSRYLGLGKDESKKLLKIVARVEEKAEQEELDFESAQYRVLIFNVSDDWIHHEQGSLVRVNEIIKERLEKIVLPELRSKIKPEDIVVITSDHGFIDLRKEYAHIVDLKALGDIDLSDVAYRYIRGRKYTRGAYITYDNKETWTVAVGHEWFERPKGAGKKARYSHGGISMAEMVVPAVRLRKKVGLRTEIVIHVEAPEEAVPGDMITIPVKVANQGTVETYVNLSCRLSGLLIAETKVKLPEGVSYTWDISVKVDPKATQLAVSAQYVTPQKEKKTVKRQLIIPIKEVGAKVSIDTSALDIFDNM